MLSILDKLRDINLLSVTFRLIAAFIIGAVIGIERSYKNRPAGFRTHILVCIGATIASMTGIYLYLNAHLPTDISRIGAQVVPGLGFIGGGTIIVTKNNKIKGLTTAAGLWACGIIGLAIGAGFYEGAIIAAILVLAAEICFNNVRHLFQRAPDFQIVLSYQNKTSLDHVLRYCKNNWLAIANLQVTGTNDSQNSLYSAIITLRPRKALIDKQALLEHIRVTVGVISVSEVEQSEKITFKITSHE